MSTSSHAGRQFEKLSVKLKLGYSFGQLVDGVVNNAANIFLLFYLTTVCGLPGVLAGAALSLGLIVDAVLDPLIGSASDAWRSRLGRRLPFMLVGAPLVVIAFVMLFSLPAGLSGTGLFVWVATLAMLLRFSQSLFLLPYQSVGAELSDDHDERSSIVAWRWTAGLLGAFAAIVIGFGVFFAGDGGLTRREAYTPFALTLGVLILLGAAISARAVAQTLNRQYPAPPGARVNPRRLFAEIAEIFRNRSFRILFGGALLMFIAFGVHSALDLHTNTFFWRLTTAQTQLVTLSLFVGFLLGSGLAGPMLRRLEKRQVLIIGLVGVVIAFTVPAGLKLLGLLRLEGTALVALLCTFQIGAAALMSAAAIAYGSMLADAADEHEQLFGTRREGLYFAGWSFAAKAATGGGTLVAGLVLELARLPKEIAKGAPIPVVPDQYLAWLGVASGPGAALLVVAGAAITQFYALDRSAHAAILSQLSARRRQPSAA